MEKKCWFSLFDLSCFSLGIVLGAGGFLVGGGGVKCIDFQYSIAQMMQEKTLKEREKRNNKNKQNEKTLWCTDSVNSQKILSLF